MIEREYRIRRLSDRSGYVVVILRGLHDVETLPKVYGKQREARDAVKAHASANNIRPLIIVE